MATRVLSVFDAIRGDVITEDETIPLLHSCGAISASVLTSTQRGFPSPSLLRFMTLKADSRRVRRTSHPGADPGVYPPSNPELELR